MRLLFTFTDEHFPAQCHGKKKVKQQCNQDNENMQTIKKIIKTFRAPSKFIQIYNEKSSYIQVKIIF